MLCYQAILFRTKQHLFGKLYLDQEDCEGFINSSYETITSDFPEYKLGLFLVRTMEVILREPFARKNSEMGLASHSGSSI